MDKAFMAHALELAQLGGRDVAPNPMVGAVIECQGTIIGQGFHQFFGGPHAEINAINAVNDKSLLAQSTLYVNLEPCAHYGKTPPCVDAIVKARIPHVIVGCRDPHPVNAGGIERLIQAGVKVTERVMEDESKLLNKRFITFHTVRRPYVILKWAESADGFIAPIGRAQWLTTAQSKKLVHKWRAEECAVMVGTNTAAIDNPALTVREVPGKNPLRIVLDRKRRLSAASKLFDGSAHTLVFSELPEKTPRKGVEFVQTSFNERIIYTVLDHLYRKEVLSLIVEGGAQLLRSFIEAKLWDEARVFVTATRLEDGIKAPQLTGPLVDECSVGNDRLNLYSRI